MQAIQSSIKRHGRSVYITDQGWTSNVYNAFVQPFRYKNKMYMDGTYTEIGHYGEGYYLYVGPGEKVLENLSNEALLHTADGKKYSIHRSERVYFDAKPIYIWAILKEEP